MKIKTCFIVFLALILSSCGVVVPEPTATITATPQPTNTLPPTSTPTKTPLPTATPNIAATQQYEDFYVWLEKFSNEGIIPSVNGTYRSYKDISQSLAQQAYFTWELQNSFVSTNFIAQAKVTIANATNENIFKSGCGFVFEEFFATHAVFFSLDGNANYRTDGRDRGSKYLDSTLFENPEGVTLTLVLYNKALLFYVNDRLALSQIVIYGENFKVGPSTLSGTSEGFGTRCDFTNIVLWKID